MRIGRKTLAALLAALVLTMAACQSENKNLIGDGTSSDAVSSNETSSAEEQAQNQGNFSFTTTDMNGDKVSFENYRSAKVIMFNMWEPWCGPCRSELPDLQKLYNKYKSEGLMIVGVYSNTDGLKDIVKENKIKYPMIKSCAAFDRFQTGYVPTTVFMDGEGKVLSDEPYVGSKSYQEWESIILSYMK